MNLLDKNIQILSMKIRKLNSFWNKVNQINKRMRYKVKLTGKQV